MLSGASLPKNGSRETVARRPFGWNNVAPWMCESHSLRQPPFTPQGVVQDWPRGGVVTQRTANPYTPVRFRPWPPVHPSEIVAPDPVTGRFTSLFALRVLARAGYLCYRHGASRSNSKQDGLIRGSSAVEQPAVNRLVVGSNPTRGAIFLFVQPGYLRSRSVPETGVMLPTAQKCANSHPMLLLKPAIQSLFSRIR